MAALNAGFLVWDVASVAAGVVSFGTATVAMQGAKAGVRGLIKAGLKKGLLKLAATRVCMLACFPAGTSVSMQEGYRNIEEVNRDQLLRSRHELTLSS